MQRVAVQEGAEASRRRPFLAGAEVVDEAEDDVVHRLPLGNGNREREVGNRPLGILGAVDRIDDDGERALAADPDLLGDDPDLIAVEVRENRRLRGLVDRRGHVPALSAPDRPLALLAPGHLREHGLHVGDCGPAQLEPVTGVDGAQTGSRKRPEVSFG